MKCMTQLWRDQRGVVASAELIVISTIVILGMIVGLVTLRDQVVQELGDLGAAVGQLNQSYQFDEIDEPGFFVAGSRYRDRADFCESPQQPGEPPACIDVLVNPTEEQ